MWLSGLGSSRLSHHDGGYSPAAFRMAARA